ncbi:MAG TPA: NAD(P)-dependent alcohol dehydrogenase, partial [Cryomorphaceae bacterium]|nr:NAD(P)-dependent alcohol dehydrogenase [Cryomorphaceae bacterium]
MRAIVFDKYGSVDQLRLEEVEKPVPQADEVRIKVCAASVNRIDLQLVQGKFWYRMRNGLFNPGKATPGIDIAGVVDALGPEAIGWMLGQEIYASLANYGFGGFAEYVCVPKSALALKPKNLSFVESAAVPTTATTAFQGLVDWGQMLSYRSVLIIGAAGGVGHFAVQMAKNYNLQVTAVSRSENLDFVKSLGADFTLSHEKMEFLSDERRYELIFDTVGDTSAHKYRKMLTGDGKYVVSAFSPSAIVSSPFGGILNNRKVIVFRVKPDPKDLSTIRKMIERGSVYPKVDRIYPLEEIKEALTYATSGNA